MDLPSRASVDVLFQAVRLVLDTDISDLSPVRRLLTQCGTVFAYFIWHTRAMLPGDEPLQCIRGLLDAIDVQLAVRILHTHGVEHPGLACVNAALWARLTTTTTAVPAREPPPLRVEVRECCRCNRRAPETCDFAPYLWHECAIEAPLCEQCAGVLELHIPLYAQPTPRWCSACGREADERGLTLAGNGCFICQRCAPLVKRHG